MNFREVVQPGRIRGLGPRGRRFESCPPDKIVKACKMLSFAGFFLSWLSNDITNVNSPVNSPTSIDFALQHYHMLTLNSIFENRIGVIVNKEVLFNIKNFEALLLIKI